MKIEVEGRQIEIDDGFADLSPEEQNATVDEIAASLGPQTQLGADRRMADDAAVAEQTTVGRQEAYNQLPEGRKFLQAGQDVARLLESGATMGFGDKMRAVSSPSQEEGWLAKAKAALNIVNPTAAVGEMLVKSTLGDEKFETNLAQERDKTQATRDRADTAAIPTEIAGALLSGSTIAKTGATLAGRFNTANLPAWLGVPARAAIAVPEGTAYGVVDAIGNDKDVATGAVTGAIAAPIGSVVGDAVSSVASKVLPRANPKEIPSLEKLKAAADLAYKEADNAGVIIRPDAMARLNEKVRTELADFGYDPALQPRVQVVLDRLQSASENNVTLKGVDIIRRIADNARKSQNADEKALGNKVIAEIDKFVDRLNGADVIADDPKTGVKALQTARTLWARASKNERFLNAIETAKNRASSGGTGANEENAMRQNVRKELERGRGYTTDEKAALKSVVRGTPTQNALRLTGKLAPTGIVSTSGSTALGAFLGSFFGPIGTAVGASALPTLGYAAKATADRGVRNAVAQIDLLIRAGGSKTALEKAHGTLRQLTEAQRQAVARILQMSVIQSDIGQQEPAQ